MSQIGIAVLPGLLAGSWIWEKQFPVFERLGISYHQLEHAFVAQDLAQTNMTGLLGACEAYIDQLPFDVIVVGNSIGALLALQLAKARPDKVVGVVASGAPGLGDEPNLGLGTRKMLSLDYALSIKQSIFYDPSRVDDSIVTAAFQKIASPLNLLRAVRLLRDIRNVDVAGLIGQTSAPTALIWGKEDKICPPSPWRVAVSGHESIEMEEIEYSGHSPMYETPDEFNVILQSFLRKICLVRQAA